MVDGIRVVLPDPRWTEALNRWGSTIGELQRLESIGVFGAWAGILVWIVPAMLFVLVLRRGTEACGWLLLLLVVAALSTWQVRWSPYFVLVFLLCLPLLHTFERFSARVGLLFTLSLWPVLAEWVHRFHPDANSAEQRHLERSERINARFAAERMRSSERHPFLAVWWQSPALAYWSGQPAVSGSGHEGISGIVDSARFFLATNPAEALEILARRDVSWVVASDSARAVENSAAVLGVNPPAKPLAESLWGGTESVRNWGLEGETNVTMFRLLRVEKTVR
jgi:hypothetical protein